MIQITLSPEAREQLIATFKTTPDRRLRDRCQAILMKADKRSQTAIAKDLHVERRTVYNWLTAYAPGGRDALNITWGPGKQAFIPARLVTTIRDWVRGGPTGCGLNRANWTYEELADYLYQREGIWVSTSTMRACCHRHQIRPYRPTYRFLRADPDKKNAAKVELATLKKADAGEVLLLSQGEARFPLVPTLRTTWG
jgi:transposase